MEKAVKCAYARFLQGKPTSFPAGICFQNINLSETHRKAFLVWQQ